MSDECSSSINDIVREPETFRDKLYTIDRRGARTWVYPATASGRFRRRRTIVAYTLMLCYLAAPWLQMRGRQAFLFDIPNRKFIIFGVEFWATDSLYLMLLLASLGLALFLFTALVGRVWCGWACPQTVYLEFLFRPIERLIEGKAEQRRRLDAAPWGIEKILKKSLKLAAFAACAWLIANTFLAYIYGADTVLGMMQHRPSENPLPFALTISVMCLFLFEFGWFREQFCTVLCPYARFQSVMLDAHSLVIGYDPSRGEPRGRGKRAQGSAPLGDCVDCGACVRVCPTGIDIRNGLQLECVNCAACIDACDEIMGKVGKPSGLIRYDTEHRLARRESRLLRPRVYLYFLLFSGTVGALFFSLSVRKPFDADIVRRPTASPFAMLGDDRISNPFFLQLANKSSTQLPVEVSLSSGLSGVEVVVPGAPISVPPGELRTVPVLINFPGNLLERGKRKVRLSVRTPLGSTESEVTLLGPD